MDHNSNDPAVRVCTLVTTALFGHLIGGTAGPVIGHFISNTFLK
ncbi:hypothetical protein [Sphingomonas sp.]|nr:hypothetical protein [Sphingomonas sp.]